MHRASATSAREVRDQVARLSAGSPREVVKAVRLLRRARLEGVDGEDVAALERRLKELVPNWDLCLREPGGSSSSPPRPEVETPDVLAQRLQSLEEVRRLRERLGRPPAP